MAEIKDVGLQIQSGSSSDKKKVTVGFKLAFSAAEAGETFSYGIVLRGEDKAGDDEASFATTGQVLYTFKFGGIPKAFDRKSVVAAAGEQVFSEVREISVETLNEDPGFATIKPAPDTTVKVPHADEVYASVTLVAAEERSTALTVPA